MVQRFSILQSYLTLSVRFGTPYVRGECVGLSGAITRFIAQIGRLCVRLFIACLILRRFELKTEPPNGLVVLGQAD